MRGGCGNTHKKIPVFRTTAHGDGESFASITALHPGRTLNVQNDILFSCLPPREAIPLVSEHFINIIRTAFFCKCFPQTFPFHAQKNSLQTRKVPGIRHSPERDSGWIRSGCRPGHPVSCAARGSRRYPEPGGRMEVREGCLQPRTAPAESWNSASRFSSHESPE